jgi:hypothetical protein
MFNFTKNENEAHFFIQLKGTNSGKPLQKPIPNSIGIKVDEKLLYPMYFYYMILHLYQSGQFTKMLKGSVVPFIRQSDIAEVIYTFLIERSRS